MGGFITNRNISEPQCACTLADAIGSPLKREPNRKCRSARSPLVTELRLEMECPCDWQSCLRQFRRQWCIVHPQAAIECAPGYGQRSASVPTPAMAPLSGRCSMAATAVASAGIEASENVRCWGVPSHLSSRRKERTMLNSFSARCAFSPRPTCVVASAR